MIRGDRKGTPMEWLPPSTSDTVGLLKKSSPRWQARTPRPPPTVFSRRSTPDSRSLFHLLPASAEYARILSPLFQRQDFHTLHLPIMVISWIFPLLPPEGSAVWPYSLILSQILFIGCTHNKTPPSIPTKREQKPLLSYTNDRKLCIRSRPARIPVHALIANFWIYSREILAMP